MSEPTPVMTASEWKDVRGFTTSYLLSNLGDGIDVIRDEPGDRESTLPLIMAVANHALPDDHPLKMTLSDVNLIREVAEDYKYRGTSTHVELQALSAKLTALLPPEG